MTNNQPIEKISQWLRDQKLYSALVEVDGKTYRVNHMTGIRKAIDLDDGFPTVSDIPGWLKKACQKVSS